MFLSRNNAPIKVIIVKNDNRYAIIKPTLERFSNNIIEINKCQRYELSDKIKLSIDPCIYQKIWYKHPSQHSTLTYILKMW